MPQLTYHISPPIDNHALNELFSTAWSEHQAKNFQPILSHSLLYVCAYTNERLVGFVNVAWDGGVHAFILDTTVHTDYQHRGIGVQLVQTALSAARERGIEWVHVDYEPHLREFYAKCGFQPTEAGLINLKR